jgi:hypothetical protein
MTPEDDKLLGRVWDYHKQLDNLLLWRINYSLVAQAMLVAAFATLSSTTQNLRLHLIEFAVGLTGLIFTAFQCRMSVSVAKKLYRLKPELERLDKIYEQHPRDAPWNAPRNIQSIWMPLLLGGLWASLLLLTLIDTVYGDALR